MKTALSIIIILLVILSAMAGAALAQDGPRSGTVEKPPKQTECWTLGEVLSMLEDGFDYVVFTWSGHIFPQSMLGHSPYHEVFFQRFGGTCYRTPDAYARHAPGSVPGSEHWREDFVCVRTGNPDVFEVRCDNIEINF